MTAAEPAAGETVLCLTDEELAVLDATPRPLVVTPHLDTLAPEQRETALRTAFRSLVSHGLVQPPSGGWSPSPSQQTTGAPGALTELDVGLAEPLHHVLALRRAAGTVVCAQCITSRVTSWRYSHRVDDEVTLDELVDADGVHRFGLLESTCIVEAALSWLLPDGEHSQDGEDGPEVVVSGITTSADRIGQDLLTRLATATVVTEIVVRHERGEAPVLLSIFAGPRVLVLSRSTPGSHAVALRSASRGTVRSALLDQLAG